MAKKTFAAVAEDMARKLKSYEKKLADAKSRGDKVGEQDYTRRIQRLQQGMNDLFNAQEMSKGQAPSPPMPNQMPNQMPMMGGGGVVGVDGFVHLGTKDGPIAYDRDGNPVLAGDAAPGSSWDSPTLLFNESGLPADNVLNGPTPDPRRVAVGSQPGATMYTPSVEELQGQPDNYSFDSPSYPTQQPAAEPTAPLGPVRLPEETTSAAPADSTPSFPTVNMDNFPNFGNRPVYTNQEPGTVNRNNFVQPTMSFPQGPDGTVNMNAIAASLPENFGQYNPPTAEEQFTSGLAEQVGNSGYWDFLSAPPQPEQPDYQTFESLDPNQTLIDDLTPPAGPINRSPSTPTNTTTEPTPQEEARRVFTPIQSIPMRGPSQVSLVSPTQQERANQSTPAQEAFDFIPDSQGDPSMGMAFTNRPMFTSTTPGTQATTAATAESPAQEPFDFIPDETDPSMGMAFTNRSMNQNVTAPTRTTTDETGATTGGTATGATTQDATGTTTGGTTTGGGTVIGDATGGATGDATGDATGSATGSATGDATGGATAGGYDYATLASLFETLNPKENKFAQYGQFLPDAYAMYQMSQTEKPVNLPEMELARQNTDLNYNPIYAGVQDNLANTLSRIDRDVSDPVARAALNRSAVNEANQRMGAGQVQEINTETGMKNEYAQRISENKNQNELIRSQNEQRQIDFMNERRAAQARLAQQAGLKFAQIHGENQNRELERQRMGLSALAFDGQIMQNMAKNLEMMKALGLMS